MRTTLQNRLTILMVGFSVLFIVVFSTIQLWAHKKNAERFLNFKARYAIFIVKEIFQEENSLSLAKQRGQISAVLLSIKNLGLVENAFAFSAQEGFIGQTNSFAADIPSKTQLQTFLASGQTYTAARIKNSIYSFVKVSPELAVCLGFSAVTIQKALSEVLTPISGIIIFVVIANFILAALLSKSLITPISLLYRTTSEIAKGNLNKRVYITTHDELEELADNFNHMTKELKKMKERAENANPLTKLPGNVVIQEEVERRIRLGEKFVVIYCDLDNFKAFNDKYGVHKGDDAIKLTADIFKEAVQNVGGTDDFIGHEGGDDFLLVTTPQRAEKIANYITQEFDQRIRSLYSQEDLQRGYIEAKARHTEEIMKFPIMTISLAGVTNIVRPINNYAEVTNIAAGLKKKAKKLPGSVFVLDKRAGNPV